MELHISKGVAIMIRAILNLDPEVVEKHVNDLLQKSELAFTTLNNTLGLFDGHLTRINAELITLKENHNRLNAILTRWENERRDFNGNTVELSDNNAAAGRREGLDGC